MPNREFLAEQYDETRQIIEDLLDDGSDPDALYTIEHHLAADNFDTLEKAAIEAFKLGYDVSDAEEVELEDGTVIICCDIISEISLNAELIDSQVVQLVKLAADNGVDYDGWGTFFEGEEGNDDDYDDDEDHDDDSTSDDDDNYDETDEEDDSFIIR